jgi:flagellar motor switch protein FliN/FliY
MADEEIKTAAETNGTNATDGAESSLAAAQADSATATLPPLAPNSGDQTIEAVAEVEQQLGDVLANLDGLTGATGGGMAGAAMSGTVASRGETSIDLLRDVMLNVKIELGRSRMYIEDILKLGEGSVVELDKLAGDPVDVFVNDRLVARGEVLVLNDNFCVRIGEIVAQE